MLQPTSCLLCPGPYIITPTPTSSLLCPGSYNNPTIPKPLHMFYPISACYAQAPTLPTQSYIKPVKCPGSHQTYHAQDPTHAPSYIKLVMLKRLHTCGQIGSLRYVSPCKPVMLRLQHCQAQHTPQTSQKSIRDWV